MIVGADRPNIFKRKFNILTVSYKNQSDKNYASNPYHIILKIVYK